MNIDIAIFAGETAGASCWIGYSLGWSRGYGEGARDERARWNAAFGLKAVKR